VLAVAAGLGALLVLYWQTAASAVAQWHSSSAYSYGYLIAPIALFLIWRERPRLAHEHIRPTAVGVAVTLVFGAVWLLADFLSIAEGRHIALVGMIQGVVLAIVGLRIYRILLFPLSYLWLMVPSGTFLLGPLQRLSHDGAVLMIGASGIPVFAEGTFIQVPEGGFIVEPGCAGLNFLLTALALSLLYGKLTYTSVRARVLCVLTALGVAVVANIARIYLIIVLTQITHRKLDIADDHLLYGWGFFALIMLGMMWLGGRFARPGKTTAPAPEPIGMRPVPAARLSAAVVAAVFAAAIPPSLAAVSLPARPAATALAMPDAIGPWKRTPGTPSWSPAAETGAVRGAASYVWNGVRADVAIAAYPAQGNGHEAASAENQPAAAPWTEIARDTARIETGSATIPVATAVIRNDGTTRTVLAWYESAGCITASRLRAKICAALVRARGRAAPGAYVAISAPRTEGGAADAALAALARALMRATPGALVSNLTAE
jgi:exosortase A